MSDAPNSFYPRRLIIAAADMLKALGHTGFKRFILEMGLPDQAAGQGSSLLDRANSLAEFVILNPHAVSPQRQTVAFEMVKRATGLWNHGGTNSLSSGEREEFFLALRDDGRDVVLQIPSSPEGDQRIAAILAESHHAEGKVLNPMSPAVSSATFIAERQKVFLVHGHDEAAWQGVARFLERLGLQAIILREQPDQGRTIIEKFEDYASEVGFAVVLLTADDFGAALAVPQQAPRARQNVVFELGYFAGKLGRGRTCLLRKGEVEMPSDLYGVIYTEMDSTDGWKIKLARELKAAKLDFSPNRVWE